jgi:ATP-dependent Clp protease adaptor protein ClpS
MVKEKWLPESELSTLVEPESCLIVWNDDVNTFDWVIETLMEVCGHNSEQAEQCALLVHNLGKYAVKNGPFELLKPQCEAITDRGINATIEMMA